MELVPHRAVYFSTSTAVYACHVDNALNVQWYFNGTVEHSIKTIYDSDFGVGILRITNISMKFNSTSIECEGVYSNNGVARSVASFLLLQGMHWRQVCKLLLCVVYPLSYTTNLLLYCQIIDTLVSSNFLCLFSSKHLKC